MKEQEEEAQVAGVIMRLQAYPNKCVVIDSEGVKPLDP
jgi:hypothetical protein